MKQTTNKKGFTIIEVVLVLAIAGLIFLMVFIALPALQRSQRDTQRRHDMDRVLAQVTNFMTNNRNRVPADEDFNKNGRFYTGYMKSSGDDFRDPNGTDYEFKIGPIDSTKEYKDLRNMIYYTTGKTCEGEKLTTESKGASKIAFQMALEGGGISCVSN